MKALEKTYRGGARADIAYASWPFASLEVAPGKLTLKVPIYGPLSFTPSQIVRIEPYGYIPFLSKGIRIRHSIKSYSYPEKILFFYFRVSSKPILARLAACGFNT